MKRKIFSILGIFGLILVVFLLTECSKETKQATCSPNLKRDFPIKLVVSNQSIDTKIALFNENNVKKVNYQIGDAVLDNESFHLLSSEISSIMDLKLSPFTIVIYCDKYLDDSRIEYESIGGLSIYSYQDGVIRHNLFKKDDSGLMIEDKAYDMQVRGIITNMLKEILDREIYPDKKDNKSYVIISLKDIPDIKLRNTRDDYLIKRKLSTIFQSMLKEAPPTPENCGGFCEIVQDEICEKKFALPEPTYECEEAPCGTNGTFNILDDEESMSTDSLNICLNYGLQYDFRDDFMVNSEIGQMYINYYYTLSSYIDGNLSVSLALTTARRLAEFNNVMLVLLDENAFSNTIVIDTTLKNKLIALIEDYRELSTDQEFNDILDVILSDLNNFSGKTRAEFLSMIN